MQYELITDSLTVYHGCGFACALCGEAVKDGDEIVLIRTSVSPTGVFRAHVECPQGAA